MSLPIKLICKKNKMIPKKIHYTWFSDNPFPKEIQDCINSWIEKMPDYELVHWGYDQVKNIDSAFLQEALSEKKWAFASDFIRLYASLFTAMVQK